jgi:hypothetical protein
MRSPAVAGIRVGTVIAKSWYQNILNLVISVIFQWNPECLPDTGDPK